MNLCVHGGGGNDGLGGKWDGGELFSPSNVRRGWGLLQGQAGGCQGGREAEREGANALVKKGKRVGE